MNNTLQLNAEYVKSDEKVIFNNLIWLTTNEAAEYLRVSPENIRVLVYRGVIRAYKFNNRNRFKREELNLLIESSLKRR